MITRLVDEVWNKMPVFDGAFMIAKFSGVIPPAGFWVRMPNCVLPVPHEIWSPDARTSNAVELGVAR